MKLWMIQNPKLVAILAFIVSFVLIGCAPPMFLSSDMSTTKTICSSTGWYGIIPGYTQVNDAIEIIKRLPFIDSESIRVFTENGFGEEPDIVWQQFGGIPAYHDGGMLVRDDRIISIQAPLSFELSLEQALDSCGEPAFVRASYDGESPFHWYEFFYPSSGMLLTGRYERRLSDIADIVPQIRIIEIEYFPAGDLRWYLKNIRQLLSEDAIESYLDEFVAWPGINATIPAYPY